MSHFLVVAGKSRPSKYFEFQELPVWLGIIEDILCGMMNPNEAIEFFPIRSVN